VGALVRARGLELEWMGGRVWGLTRGRGRSVGCLPRSDLWMAGLGDETTGSLS
jgi:hypothetical protein